MRSSDSGYDEDEGTRTWVGKVMRPGSAKSWNWSGPGRQVWLRSLLTAFVSVSRMLRGVTAPLLGIQTNRFPARTSFSRYVMEYLSDAIRIVIRSFVFISQSSEDCKTTGRRTFVVPIHPLIKRLLPETALV